MNRRHMTAAGALASCITAIAIATTSQATAVPTVTISGSETTGALVADLIYFYRRSVKRPPRFVLSQGGTPLGVSDAFRGVSTIGLASRDRRDDDPAVLVFTPVARTAVCFATNKANPVPTITRADFQALAAGRLTSWAGFPGATSTGTISAIGYPSGEGAQAVIERALLSPGTTFDAPLIRWQTSSQVRRAVLGSRNGLGWLDFAYRDGLNIPTLDGVPCSRDTIANGTYPAKRSLNFVTSGAPTGAAAKFITWTRTSRVARRVVNTRYVSPAG